MNAEYWKTRNCQEIEATTYTSLLLSDLHRYGYIQATVHELYKSVRKLLGTLEVHHQPASRTSSLVDLHRLDKLASIEYPSDL